MMANPASRYRSVFFFLDSLQRSSKAESPNKRTAKQPSVGTLLEIDLIHNIFVFLWFIMARIQVLLLIFIMVANDRSD